MAAVTFRNAITDARHQVDVSPGQTVRQVVETSGFVASGNDFSVRDKNGIVVDSDQATKHEGTVLTVGLAGDTVRGGARSRPR
jgi:hypothetical protein